MERARKRRRTPDGFYELVKTKAGLMRACSGDVQAVTERDMRMLWEAFVAYVEGDCGDAGELPVCNLGAVTSDEGRRSNVIWEVEDVQDMFYGGQEADPHKIRGDMSKREAMRRGGISERERQAEVVNLT